MIPQHANTGNDSGVPGELRGLEYVHKKYGKLQWKDVVLPAAGLARDGFTVGQDLASYIDKVSPNDFLMEDPAWAIDFAPNGQLVQEGDTMTRKRYAATLETIAEKGADAFYEGPIAEATIAAVQAANGTMTLDDLKNYAIAHGDPVTMKYGDYTLTTVGAPASGAVALSTLNILSGYPNFGNAEDTLVDTHRLIEAMKFAYGQRSLMGDPEYESDVAELVANMTNADTGAELRAKISDSRTHNATYYEPKNLISDDPAGTSHLASADASGMSVSLTTTVNTLFGSKVMVPETGIIMNNQMDDFSVPGKDNAFGYVPNPANYIKAGKRPLSSISPVIVEDADGGLYYTIGAAGGSRIISSTIQNLIHVLDHGLTVAEALAKPRLHDQLRPTETSFEWTYSNETVSYLEELGHNVTWMAPGSSSAQGTRLLPNGTFEASGEPRQGDSGGLAV